MKIGLNGGAATVDRMVEQAVRDRSRRLQLALVPERGRRRPAGRDGARRARDHDLGVGHRGAADVHVAPGADGEPRARPWRRRWAQRVHARHRAVARAGDRGLVRDVVREPGPSHRGVRHDPRPAAARRSGRVPRRRLRRPPRRPAPPPRCDRAGARRRARTPAAARRRRGRRRHHPLDGQRARHRDPRRAR